MLEDSDKTIEVIKAAMEKESNRMDRTKDTMENQMSTDDQDVLFEETISDAEAEEIISEDEEMEENSIASEDEIEAAADADGRAAKQSKSFFKSGKNKELAAKELKIEELTDRLMRNMAEFDNYRKRTEKEKSQMYDIGVKSLIEKLLPVIDNFERGLGALTDKDKENAFAQGMELIYKQLTSTLEEIGVKQIEAVGKEFDPALHNAVMHGEDETMGENIITDEFQKGYTYRDTVVRYIMEKVVN